MEGEMSRTRRRRTIETPLHYITDGTCNPAELYDFIQSFAEQQKKPQTLKALPFGRKMHSGQYRLGGGNLDYYYHPMSACAHAIALGITRDEVLAASLLHDVCEDCSVTPEELPVRGEVRKAVAYLTRDKQTGWTLPGKELYYKNIQNDKTAVLVKLLDRCDNISTMHTGFNRDRMIAYGKDTACWIYPLFEKALQAWPEYRIQLAMIRLRMDAVLETIQALTASDVK